MNKKIALGITGSIAAYKAIELIKLLDQKYQVKIVMSKAAEEFVSSTTLRSLFPERVFLYNQMLSDKDEMLHISLAKEVDLLLVAPCSANSLAKFTRNSADCLLSQIYLATEAKVALVPAMNKVMWDKTKQLAKDLSEKEVMIWGPDIGLQACGDFGEGRMLEVEEISYLVDKFFTAKILKDKKILITAGPTREFIDPIRYISNQSSGKMGYKLAKKAHSMGAEVTLISGFVQIDEFMPKDINIIKIDSAQNMSDMVMENIENMDLFISTAAVADYRPKLYNTDKIKKNASSIEVELIRNEDIISSVHNKHPHLDIIGFAAETTNLLHNAKQKLLQKHLKMIVANDVSQGKVFAKDTNEVYILSKEGENIFLQEDLKENIAEKILSIYCTL